MRKLRFYGRRQSALEEVLPRLLEKVLNQNLRAVVLFNDNSFLEVSDKILWTYTPLSFLPHGTKNDGLATNHPIWLTTTLENPNHSQLCILTCYVPHIWEKELFAQYIYIFNIDDENELSSAKAVWSDQKKNFDVGIWQQDQRGKWVTMDTFDKIP